IRLHTGRERASDRVGGSTGGAGYQHRDPRCWEARVVLDVARASADRGEGQSGECGYSDAPPQLPRRNVHHWAFLSWLSGCESAERDEVSASPVAMTDRDAPARRMRGMRPRTERRMAGRTSTTTVRARTTTAIGRLATNPRSPSASRIV